MIIDYCPVVCEHENGASWRCNLLAEHFGDHDTGFESWPNPGSNGGPDRLCVAAVNLLGSAAGIGEIEDELRRVLNQVEANLALYALRDVLLRWREGAS